MKKVLITDDEPRIVRLIRGMIDWKGLSLELAGEASNGYEALHILEERGADILIADIKMPGMDGLQLAGRAMERNPQLSVIIISGYKEFDYAYSALKKGVCDYLIKPINRLDLDRSLRRILNLQQADHAALQGELEQYRRQQIVANCVHGIADIDETLEDFNRTHSFRFRQGLFGALTATLAVSDSTLALRPALLRTQDVVCAALTGLCCDLECVTFQNYCCCVFNAPEADLPAVRQRLRELKQMLDARITDEFALPVLLGVGRFSDQLAQIPVCCAEAMLCCRSACLTDRTRTIFADALRMGLPYSILTTRHAETFRSAVARFDGEALRQCVLEIAEFVRPILREQPWQLEYFLRELAELFRREIAKGRIEVPPDELERVVARLLLCGSLDSLLEELNAWFADKIQSYHDTITDHYREPIRIARRYIDQHFAEQLSLTDICAEVGFSYHYFSALFKQETGESITDYITRVRIDHAKLLLTTTRDSVQKIANRSGYLDWKHFSKTFLRQVGIRPLEYRRLRS